MLDYFLEFEFSSENSNYWLPIIIPQTNSDNANETRDAVKTALEKQYQNVETKEPRIYKKGFSSNYLDKYVANRLRGRIEILTITTWHISETECKQVLDFDNLRPEKSDGCSFTVADGTELYFKVAKIARWPTTNSVDALIINVFQPSS